MNKLIPNPLFLSVKKTIRRVNKDGYNLEEAMMASGCAVVYFAERAQIMYVDPFKPFKVDDNLKNVIIANSMELAKSYFDKLADVNPSRLFRKDEIITCIDLALSEATLMVYDEDSVKPKEGWAYPSNIQIANEASEQAGVYLELV